VDELPILSGVQVVDVVNQVGYVVDCQAEGCMILRRGAPPHRRLTVPNHKELAKGTLRAIIREAGLTVDQFQSLL